MSGDPSDSESELEKKKDLIWECVLDSKKIVQKVNEGKS